MSDYRPYRVPGGNYFFTIYLLERPIDFLVWHIEPLREAGEVYDSRATIPLSTPGSCFPITRIA